MIAFIELTGNAPIIPNDRFRSPPWRSSSWSRCASPRRDRLSD